MCDFEKYEKIYRELEKLQPEDTLQMILESKDENMKEFYANLGNHLLRVKQKRLVQEGVF